MNGRLFLGIDHTAIAVSNTDASLAFCRDLLGLRVAGESDNYGFEQEYPNNVFDAHHADYFAPRPQAASAWSFWNTKRLATDARRLLNASPADLSHHETVLLVDDITA